jgi:hypothetical protein
MPSIPSVPNNYRALAQGYALTDQRGELTVVANLFVSSDRKAAIKDALDAGLQGANPAYCAQLCTLLAERPESGEPNWNREAAKLYALISNQEMLARNQKEHTGNQKEPTCNQKALSVCAQKFLNDTNRRTVIQDALDAGLQGANPAYCAQLGTLLSKAPLSGEPNWNREAAKLYALAGNKPALSRCASSFASSDENAAVEDALDAGLQAANPAYCAELCSFFSSHDPRRSDWPKWSREAAKLFALFGNLAGLTKYAARFIEFARNIAIQDALDAGLQAANPAYCAQLCSLLVEEKFQRSGERNWNREAAKLYALAGNQAALSACARGFLNNTDRHIVIKDALDAGLRAANPAYCAQLCALLVEKKSRESGERNWHREAAKLYALTGNWEKLTEHARALIAYTRYSAIQDAVDRALQAANPVYCVQLCSLLSAENQGLREPNWNREMAKLYALTRNWQGLTACAGTFIASDRDWAILDAMDADLQAANPAYCAQLCASLAVHRKAGERNWNREAAKLYALTGNWKALCVQAKAFVNSDGGLAATQDIIDIALRRANPQYCSEVLAQLRILRGNEDSEPFPAELPLSKTWVLYLLTKYLGTSADNHQYMNFLWQILIRLGQEGDDKGIQSCIDFIAASWTPGEHSIFDTALICLLAQRINMMIAVRVPQVDVISLLRVLQCFIRSIPSYRNSVFSTLFIVRNADGTRNSYTPLNILSASLGLDWGKMESPVRNALMFTIKMMLNVIGPEDPALIWSLYQDDTVVDHPLRLLVHTFVTYCYIHPEDAAGLHDVMSSILSRVSDSILDYPISVAGQTPFVSFQALETLFFCNSPETGRQAANQCSPREGLLAQLSMFGDRLRDEPNNINSNAYHLGR